jgi:transposase
MKPYSDDLREKIVVAYTSNEYSQREIAALFGVSESTVWSVVRRHRTTGSSAALPHGGGRQSGLSEAISATLRSAVAAQNDRTLEELCTLLKQQHKLTVSRPTMCRWLRELRLTRKKRLFAPANNLPLVSSSSAKTTASR